MYGSLAGMELGFEMLTLLAAWIVGSKASALVYSGSEARLRRKIGRLTAWAAIAALLAVAVLVCEIGIAAVQPAIYWEDRLFIHVPLIAVPLVVVWGYSLPRLWRYRRQLVAGQGAASAVAEPAAHAAPLTLPTELRAAIATPGVVLPFQAAAIGAATAFYFTLAVPFPFRPLQAAAPLFLCVLAIVGLWMLHDRRWQRAAQPEADFTDRHWRRRARTFAISCAGAAIAIAVVAIGSHNSRLPKELDMAVARWTSAGAPFSRMTCLAPSPWPC